MNTWQPLATMDTLRQRARILSQVRRFFEERDVLEVDIPCLSPYSVTDPMLDALLVSHQQDQRYLQTSPEYFMKRLLAAGSGSIYALGKAFRAEEQGRYHRNEFTMLEWYRCGYDDAMLANEVCDLLHVLMPDLAVERFRYGDLFARYLGCNPYRCDAQVLADIAAERLNIHWPDTETSTWLDLLFTHCIEPELSKEAIVVVYDYPVQQCALARLSKNAEGDTVAKRFEVYCRGMELANGYWELTDPSEQRHRFDNDNATRLRMGKPVINIDPEFMSAIEHGLPDCAGVALGVDRLVMAVLGMQHIQQQASF